MAYFDTHAHLDFVENLVGVLNSAKAANVSKIVSVGTSIEASKKCVGIAQQNSSMTLEIYASCGIHAEDGKGDIKEYKTLDACMKELRKIAASSAKVIGIGECGLDYHLVGGSRSTTGDQEKMFQRQLFRAQAELASDLKLPIIVHCRNAWGETFEILSNFNLTGVFHSWTGNVDDVKMALSLGYFISFSGIVTFKKAKEIREAAKIAPLDRVVVETDSPYLSPEPARGATNEPKNVKITADFLAELYNLNKEEFASISSKNADRLFKL